jgi:N-acetylmuramoyl-L-alanine amidase
MLSAIPRTLLLAAVFCGLSLDPAAGAPPGRKTPSRPALAPTGGGVKIDGVEYVEISDLVKRFGWQSRWVKLNERVQLKNSTTKLEISADSREIAVNGLRVLMGSSARWSKKKLCIARIDADKLVIPILRPGYEQTSVPDLKVIAIDPGHGGVDFGMLNEHLKLNEKGFALDTSLRLKKLLEAQGYRVVMTRTDDRKVELSDRPALAAKAGADLFLSIHYNAEGPAKVQNVTGTEVYRFTPRYQIPVNRAESEEDDDVESAADKWGHWSSVLGFTMQQTLLGKLGSVDRGFKHRKLAVLRHATCPAILIEAGFLSNDAEAKKIATPAYRQQIAEAMAAGVEAYGALLERLRASGR